MISDGTANLQKGQQQFFGGLVTAITGHANVSGNFGQQKRMVDAALPKQHTLMQMCLQGGQKNPFFGLGGSPVASGGRIFLNWMHQRLGQL